MQPIGLNVDFEASESVLDWLYAASKLRGQNLGSIFGGQSIHHLEDLVLQAVMEYGELLRGYNPKAI